MPEQLRKSEYFGPREDGPGPGATAREASQAMLKREIAEHRRLAACLEALLKVLDSMPADAEHALWEILCDRRVLTV